MRYYDLKITNAKTGKPLLPPSLRGLGITSLLPNGQTNPAALNVELDIPISTYATPGGRVWIRVWGLGLQDIGAAFDLNGAYVEFRAGMQKGLPLANPKQAGLIVKGQVYQALGNWVGTAQTVDLFLLPATGTQDAPVNYVLDWKAGQPLAEALRSTLAIALPTARQIISINSNLVQSHDEPHYCGTLGELASLVKARSKAINTDPAYRGIEIAYNGDQLVVSDLTTPPAAKAIQFQDLVGQPTWIDFGIVQIKTVLRSDIALMDTLTLPQTVVTNSPNSLPQFRDKLSFSGKFSVIGVHHYGNFRQPDAASWNTTLDLTPLLNDRAG